MRASNEARFSPVRTARAAQLAAQAAQDAGVILHTASGSAYTGRHVSFEEHRCMNFGSCSYLGLECRSDLRLGVEDAVRRFGTQFPFARIFLQCPLYEELEANLASIAGRPVLVCSNTTFCHISAIPLLVSSRDAVVIDQFAHASMQMALGMLHGVEITHLRHSHMSQLRKVVGQLSQSHDAVWYICDGLYSMLGDFAPLDSLAGMLEEFPKLHIYADDAHSTSWVGQRGRGCVLDSFADHERVVVTLSLNKAFSAAGGALAFPSSELYWKVRRGAGPMIFSGPIQPPMLGAAVASSRIHLSEDFSLLQQGEAQRIRLAMELASKYEIPLGSPHASPIFFVPCGPEEAAYALARSLVQSGYYASPSTFPAVPRKHAGIRFTISMHNELADIEGFISTLAREYGRLGISRHRSSSKRSSTT